jgi:hypothetical protein
VNLTGLPPLEQLSNDDVSSIEISSTRLSPFDPFNMEVDAANIAVSDDLSLVAESGGWTSIITVKDANSGESCAVS